MKISQINFNLKDSSLNPKKISLNLIPQKVNFQRRNQDTFTKSSSFSNEDALRLIRTELQNYMEQEDIDIYMKKLQEMCNRLGIEPKKLPINKNHPGDLKPYQWQQISFLVKEDAISTKK